MNYEENLVKSVKNPDGHLWFDDSGSLSYLEGIAEDSYSKGTTEGYFTAAIIYHQLTEKILLLLIKYSDLVVQAKMYPSKLDTSYQDLDSFGQLMKRHKTTVVFSKKSTILKNADEINQCRIKLVHNIHQLKHEENIDPLSKKVHDNFRCLFDDWQQDAMKWFYHELAIVETQETWQRLLKKYHLS